MNRPRARRHLVFKFRELPESCWVVRNTCSLRARVRTIAVASCSVGTTVVLSSANHGDLETRPRTPGARVCTSKQRKSESVRYLVLALLRRATRGGRCTLTRTATSRLERAIVATFTNGPTLLELRCQRPQGGYHWSIVPEPTPMNKTCSPQA